MKKHFVRLVACTVLLAAVGCGGGGGSVSGDVTYEGEPVKDGYISFIPTDGRGQTAAGPIKDGKYSVSNVPLGKKTVKVEASSGAGPSVQSQGDMEKLSKEWMGKVGPSGIISTETVPANADGNNQSYDVQSGTHVLNLTLKKPAGKK
jgi:hypothetical protein